MRPIFKISILLLFPLFTFGQRSAKEWLKDAENYFENGRFDAALNAYNAYKKLNAQDANIYNNIAICHYELTQYDDAKRFLNYTLEKKNDNTTANLYMAKTLHADGQFKEAIGFYKKYLSETKTNSDDRRKVKDDIKRCAVGIYMVDNSDLVFVQNMGDKVNGQGDDFYPVLSPTSENKIYFSSSRETSVGGLRNENGIRDDKLGNYCADMYSIKLLNGDWDDLKPLSYLVNSPRHDVVLDFSSDGQLMYYYKGFNLFSGEIYVDTFKTFDQRTLNFTPFQGPLDAAQGDGTPQIINDTMMLFSSRRAGGFGGADLYYALFQNGQWQTPQNFGNQVNSGYDEVSPFLASDGRTLYFSSNNITGVGDFDIYKVVFDDAKMVWQAPKNLGFPINSPNEDAFFKLNYDGSKGFFSAKRKGGFGGRDLYTVFFKTPQAEQELSSVPDFFFKVVPKEKVATTSETKVENKIITYKFSPILYDKESDLLSAKNKSTLDALVLFLTQHPEVAINIVSHSEETSSLDLDAFLSVKRAEKVSEYLVKNGAKAQQINLLGCGANYPIAQNSVDGVVNKLGQKSNRRLDIYCYYYEKLPVKVVIETASVPEYLQSGEFYRFKNIFKGLSYRVQVASLKQLYQGDVLKKYPDVTVEKTANSDVYDFAIGMFTTYNAALQIKKDLEKEGLPVQIIPYINGQKISDNAKGFVAQYPDLQNFIKNKK